MIYLRPNKILKALSFQYAYLSKVSFSFAEEKGERKIFALTESEQTAFLSFYTMKFIMDCENVCRTDGEGWIDIYSIRQKLLNRNNFINKILKYVNQHSKVPIKKFAEIGVSEATFDKVLEGFQLGKGCEITESLLRKGNFSNFANCSPRRAVLNPVAHSGRIIEALFSGKGALITGEKNTGKSFAILTYAYLSDFVLRCRAQNSEFSPDFFEVVPKLSFFSLPKLIYLSLVDDETLRESDLREQLSIHQTKGKIDLKSIIGEEQKKGNCFVCVVDKAEEYYTAFKKRQNHLADDYSDQLKQLSEIFGEGLFLKSQCDFSRNKINQQNQNNLSSLFDYFKSFQTSKGLKQRQKMDINFSQILNSQLGNLQLFSAFHFEIIQHLLSLGVQLNNQCFLSDNLYEQFDTRYQANKWKTDLRFHSFRNFFPKCNFSDIITELKKEEPQWKNIAPTIKNLKMLLQKQIHLSNWTLFQKYYQIPHSKQQNALRIHFLCLSLGASVRAILSGQIEQKFLYIRCKYKGAEFDGFYPQILRAFEPIVFHEVDSDKIRFCTNINEMHNLARIPFDQYFYALAFSSPRSFKFPASWPKKLLKDSEL